MSEATAEQIAEFKKRKANPTTTVEEREKFNKLKLSPKQLQAFLKATDKKCDGD